MSKAYCACRFLYPRFVLNDYKVTYTCRPSDVEKDNGDDKMMMMMMMMMMTTSYLQCNKKLCYNVKTWDDFSLQLEKEGQSLPGHLSHLFF